MSNVKNEHYIPRFYLKRFSVKKVKKAYVIDVFNKKCNKKLLNQNVKNFACMNKFYDIELDKIKEQLDIYLNLPNIDNNDKDKLVNDTQILEHYFSNVENDLKPLLDNLEQNHELIKDNIFKIKFCIFIRDLSIRTNGFREQIKKIASITLNQMKKLDIKKMGKYDMTNSADEIAKQEQIQALLSLPLQIKDGNILMNEYDFYVGVNKTNIPFIISDQPALYVFLKANEICIPISKNTAIIMLAKGDNLHYFTDIKPHGFEIILSEKQVTYYNIIQYTMSSEFVFGDMREINRIKLFEQYSQILKKVGELNK